MHNNRRVPKAIPGAILRAATAALAIAILFALAVALTPSAQAQTFQVIYNFNYAQGGAYPAYGLTMDKAGNLYGTTYSGVQPYYNGTAFELKHAGSSWIFNNLYTFQGGNDGSTPGPISFGPDGSLYGATNFGGGSACGGDGCGTVFNLKPPAVACRTALCSWTEAVIYRFTGGDDGHYPNANLVFDQAGNLYGTTDGLAGGNAIVYQLTRSNGGWKANILYSFTGGSDGGGKSGGVIFDEAGNLYGATYNGGVYGYGTVFQLSPSGSGWTEKTLYAFPGGSDNGNPIGNLVLGRSGNLYGITEGDEAGPNIVFMLSPSNGNWTYSVIYDSGGYYYGEWPASLNLDATGNLYGTLNRGGVYYNGNVFKLTRSGSAWEYTDLYDFTGGSDGGLPAGHVAVDTNGNVYGTANTGGLYGSGVAYEIRP